MDDPKNSAAIRTSARGFTLIEMMVSLSILAVGLLAVAAMQVVAIRTNTSAGLINVGYALMEDMGERIRAEERDTVEGMTAGGTPLTGSSAVSTAVTMNRPYTVSWTLTPDANRNGFARVAVTVTWDDIGDVSKTWTITDSFDMGTTAY